MTYEPVFETGSMAGLMALFRRHSGLLTNFSIFLEISPLLVLRRVLRAQAGMGRKAGPGRDRSPMTAGLSGVRQSWYWLGPGNTNGGRVAGYPVYHPPSHPTTAPPRVLPSQPARAVASGARAGSVLGTCTYGRFGVHQGDPRGGKRTVHGGRAIPPRTGTACTLLIALAAA